MEWIEILKYSSAFIVGFIMGLLGGGGSILTIPIFVYLFFINPVTATAYSLFVVGFTASVGAIRNLRHETIDFKAGLIFGIPAFVGTYVTRRYLLPALPDQIIDFGHDWILTKDLMIMILFAIMMLMASFSMINSARKEKRNLLVDKPSVSTLILSIIGLVAGILTGFVGAGGGFIIVPALSQLARLPIRIAIGTSLFVIALKSFIGFVGDLQTTAMDWQFLFIFTLISMIGIMVGVVYSQKVKTRRLKSWFGYFVLIIGVYVILRETIF